MTITVRLEDLDQSGYGRSIALLDEHGRALWARTPPTAAHDDVWTAAEVRRDRVVAWTWSCFMVTFSADGDVISSTFTN